MPRKIALITGASSGIGETFARKLAARGYALILTARREDRLRHLASELPDAEALPADLATPAGLEKIENTISSSSDLELLVNNAGFGTLGRFWQTSLARQQQMLDVHITATMRLTYAALPGMVERRRGGVINVSSVAAFNPSVGNVMYCSSKAWINSFTEGLDMELRGVGSPVHVQALCPGFTVTEFHDALGIDRRLIPAWMWITSDRVVKDSLRGLDRGKVIVVPGWKYKVVVALMKHTPDRFIEAAQKLRQDRRV